MTTIIKYEEEESNSVLHAVMPETIVEQNSIEEERLAQPDLILSRTNKTIEAFCVCIGCTSVLIGIVFSVLSSNYLAYSIMLPSLIGILGLLHRGMRKKAMNRSEEFFAWIVFLIISLHWLNLYFGAKKSVPLSDIVVYLFLFFCCYALCGLSCIIRDYLLTSISNSWIVGLGIGVIFIFGIFIFIGICFKDTALEYIPNYIHYNIPFFLSIMLYSIITMRGVPLSRYANMDRSYIHGMRKLQIYISSLGLGFSLVWGIALWDMGYLSMINA
ncbi:hypothetical protein NEFER03_0167 [Nematocida sp. LUAm3]|nr:hypothetical protein NEFER03_0167 [Nematocida sp. LUAm3]